MISTTLNGETVWVIPFEPSWREKVSVWLGRPVDILRSLTGRETRTPLAASLRASMRWQSILEQDDLNLLRNGLEEAQDERIVVPLWPFAVPGDDWPGAVSGGLTIGWMDGWGTWALNPATPSDWDWVAPALIGRLETRVPRVISTAVVSAEFTIAEDSSADLALAPAAVSWSTGPALNDSTEPHLWPFSIDWGDDIRTGAPAIEVDRKAVGRASRVKQSTVYPQAPRLSVDASATLYGAECSAIVRWWQDHAEAVAHYAPTFVSAVRLVADAEEGANEVEITSIESLGDYRYLAFDTGTAIHYARVISEDGNTLTLDSALPFDLPADTTVVSVVTLARHSESDIKLDFAAPHFATAQVSWVEVPEEYLPPEGETRGETLGDSTTIVAWLYKVTVDRAGSSTVYRATSYERDITIGADTWSASPGMHHGEIRASVQLDRDDIEITTRAGGWTNEFLPGRMSGQVLLEISTCEVDGGTGENVDVVWTGEIVSCSFDGPNVEARARGPYAAFDRPIPRFLLQPGCNHTLFDSRCGLDSGDWTFTAAHVSTSGHEVTLGTWSRPGGLPTGWGFAGYFALGYLERADGSRVFIVSSTLLDSGLITLRLARPVALDSGEAVSVVPGCDGRSETCNTYHSTLNPEGKFDNFLRFGGFPFIPATNPAFTPEAGDNRPNAKK